MKLLKTGLLLATLSAPALGYDFTVTIPDQFVPRIVAAIRASIDCAGLTNLECANKYLRWQLKQSVLSIEMQQEGQSAMQGLETSKQTKESELNF